MNLFLIVVRFVHFGSAMALFGASVFLAALAPPLLRAQVAPPLKRIIVVASVAAAVSAALWLLLEAGLMTGDWRAALQTDALAAVLEETGFGHVWRARLALALLLLVLAFWRGVPPAIIAALSGLFLASLGLVGHAAMLEHAAGLFERANQALHLLAGGFWLGALPPLLICLRRLGEPGFEAQAGVALRRFSGLGHVAVAAVLATGIANTFMILGRPPTNFASPYQASLAMKILTVAAMILLALYNRYQLAPRLALKPEARLALARNTAIEIGLGGVVLALVSVFATFDPA
ncbi:MAG TPA: copper homeostasis membrane protein CopD [Roseiarcus sp.]|nr:copper homeostasis membrane protein CopD [Roseiarcus sp.]